MTPTQTKVLSILRASDRPLKAYDVLAALRDTQPTAGPPTAYRALGKLIEAGLAHRLESVNAYIACCLEHTGAASAFTICDGCGMVREHAADAMSAPLTEGVRHDGFEPRRAVLELHGICRDCREDQL